MNALGGDQWSQSEAGGGSIRYRAHGLDVVSAVELPALIRTNAPSPRGDVEIRWDGGSRLSSPADPAVVLLQCSTRHGAYYTGSAFAEGYRLTFHGHCEFLIDGELRTATCVGSGSLPSHAQVLASGALLSFILAIRGHCVLHASAVQMEGRAIAIVGASGFGKSTVAAALCGVACKLVTDDVLRVDLDADAPAVARRGVREIRLRAGARGIQHHFDPPVPSRETSDGRTAIRPAMTPHDEVPLSAIVVPRPSTSSGRLMVERLAPAVALRQLLTYPRLLGWQHAATLARQLSHLAAIARQVPMYVVNMPSGLPTSQAGAAQLLERLSSLATDSVTV